MCRFVCLAIGLLAFSSSPVAAQFQYPDCDFDSFWNMSKISQDSLVAMVRDGPRLTEIVFDLPVPPDRAAETVMTLFVRCNLPVSQNSGGVIEATLVREKKLLSAYEIVARAYIVLSPTGSTVTLAAEETQYSGKAYSPDVFRERVSNRSKGRARATWMAFRAIRAFMLSDSVKTTVAPIEEDSDMPAVSADTVFLGWISRKMFMLPSCGLTTSIPEDELVRFASESEAKTAGFIRSGAEGC